MNLHSVAIEQLTLAAAQYETAASIATTPNAKEYLKKAKEIRESIDVLLQSLNEQNKINTIEIDEWVGKAWTLIGGDPKPEITPDMFVDILRKIVSISYPVVDIMFERNRQITSEGWSHSHDDEHKDGSIALAASCYARSGAGSIDASRDWPWDQEWFKQTTARRDLIKSAALILAEIERIDRINGRKMS